MIMVAAGLGWISMLTSLNVAAQMASPTWVKARALAVYLLVFQGAMTGGSLLWGLVAARTNIATALTIAALGQALAVALALKWRLPLENSADLTPSGHWTEPDLAADLEPLHGPVLVEIEYQIAPQRAVEFTNQLRDFKAMRLRDGAIRWNVWQDAAEPSKIIEAFVVETWLNHQRQHARVTHADQIAQNTINAFHIGESPPRVRHLLTPQLP